MNEEDEYNLQFVEPRDYSAKTLKPSKQPFDVISLRVQLAAVLPDRKPVAFRRNHRFPTQVEHKLSCVIVFIGLIQDHFGAIPPTVFPCFQPFSSCRRVTGLPRREGKGYRSVVADGNPVNVGCPSASGLADRLRTVFLGPVHTT